MTRIRKRRRKAPLGPWHGYVACDWLLRAFCCDPHKIQGARVGAVSAEPASTPAGTVFLSYASQDSEAAQRICDALRAAGIEVWFDQSELRGGDAWDRHIRERIHDCRLFIAVISANTEARDEGYFRREWGLAVDRTRDMDEKKAFLLRRAADIALKLDGKNARAHFVLGFIHVSYDWGWAEAEQEFQHVATLAPGSADPLVGEAALFLALGRWDDALRQIKAALAQDPVRATSFFYLSELQLHRGDLAQAEAAMRAALDIRPTYEWAHWLLGLVLLARGQHQAAIQQMQQMTLDDGRESGLAIVYHALGRKPDSDASLARLLKDQTASPFLVAEVYAFRGGSDEAMRWLERAYTQKDPGLIYLKVEWPLRSLQGDARLKAFLRKMNLPE